MLKRRYYSWYYLGLCFVIASVFSADAAVDNSFSTVTVKKIPVAPIHAAAKKKDVQGSHTSLKKRQPIIVAIDAGHGGKDPGAVGPTGLQEKQVTLAIAYRLSALLRQDSQFRPVLIRTHDQFIAVGERVNLARQQHAQLLISIHADGAVNYKAHGASVWVLSNRRAHLEVGRRLAKPQAIPLKTVVPHSGDYQVCRTLLELQFGYSQQVGYRIAQFVLQKLDQITKLHKRTPEYASLGVLQSIDIPSILVESGFITHATEESLLRRPRHQQKIAQALYQGIKQYYQTYPPCSARSSLTQQSTNSSYSLPVKDSAAASQHREHVVQAGETLFAIARRYRTTWYHLQQHNQLPNHRLRIGQRLQIPEAVKLAK